MKKYEVEKILSVLKRIQVSKIEDPALRKNIINAILFFSRTATAINNELIALENTYFGDIKEELKAYADELQAANIAESPIARSVKIQAVFAKYPKAKVADENFGEAKNALMMQEIEGFYTFSLDDICSTGIELSGGDIVTLTPIIE